MHKHKGRPHLGYTSAFAHCAPLHYASNRPGVGSGLIGLGAMPRAARALSSASATTGLGGAQSAGLALGGAGWGRGEAGRGLGGASPPPANTSPPAGILRPSTRASSAHFTVESLAGGGGLAGDPAGSSLLAGPACTSGLTPLATPLAPCGGSGGVRLFIGDNFRCEARSAGPAAVPRSLPQSAPSLNRARLIWRNKSSRTTVVSRPVPSTESS